jgi:hypothetical protein
LAHRAFDEDVLQEAGVTEFAAYRASPVGELGSICSLLDQLASDRAVPPV